MEAGEPRLSSVISTPAILGASAHIVSDPRAQLTLSSCLCLRSGDPSADCLLLDAEGLGCVNAPGVMPGVLALLATCGVHVAGWPIAGSKLHGFALLTAAGPSTRRPAASSGAEATDSSAVGPRLRSLPLQQAASKASGLASLPAAA